MAGLIDVGIIKPELANSFATGYQQAEQTRQQNEMNQLKLDQLKQDRAMLTELQTKLRAAGHSDDPNQFFKAMIQTGNPDYMAKGYEGLQRYKELQRAEKLLAREFGTPDAAPAAGASAPSIMRMQPPAATPAPVNALGSGTFDPNAAPVNALTTPPAAAPATPAAAPVNALAAPNARVQELRRKIVEYGSVNDPRLKALVPIYQAELNELVKPQVVSPGSTVFRGGQAVFTAPAAPTELDRLIATRNALPPGDPRRMVYDNAIKKQTTHAPGTTVNVSTEKAYGSAFGGKLADVDIGKLTTAEKAPALAESANRIIGLVQQGNVFTGPAADVKLNLARALNVAGANNQEKIANTESLIAATGQSTLDAIKGAGLGTGQGFTDKDLKFLQGVAGGTVTMTPQTLTELATLQHRAASRSADAWNKRVKEMPQNVVQGTGLSTAPVTVAPLQPVMKGKNAAVSAAPAGVDPALWNVMTPQERALWQTK